MPIDSEIKPLETQVEIDMDSALADLSSELFGQDDAGEETASRSGGEPVEAEAKPSADVLDPAPQPIAENSPEVKEIGAPDTWTKEALAEWATVPPRVQQEIQKREADFLKGIGQYKEAAEAGNRYQEVVAPFKQALDAEQVDPVQLFQSFASNHYLLSRGTPQQKVEVAANLMRGYGIDPLDLMTQLGNYTPPAPVDPDVQSLRDEVNALKADREAREAETHNQAFQRIQAEVNAFAKDPEHPYFDELTEDIRLLMKSGLAPTLADAYERAVYANPTTRGKELARLASVQSQTPGVRETKIAKATAADLRTTPKTRDGAIPVGTMDETMEATLAEIRSRG